MKAKKSHQKKKRPSDELAEATREITQQLECARFDQAGLRIHDRHLLEPKQIFFPWFPSKGMGKAELTELLAKEYARECRWSYEYQAGFLAIIENSTPKSLAHFRTEWPPFLVGLINYIFPFSPLEGASKTEIDKMLTAAPATDISLISKAAPTPIFPSSDPRKDYLLSIDWRKGPEAVERSLAAWIRQNAPRGLPTLRGRNNAVDRFNELAAYRAKRAGLDHASFGTLIGRIGGNAVYSDQPQFLRAVRATARRLKRFDSDVRRMIATHRKKNK